MMRPANPRENTSLQLLCRLLKIQNGFNYVVEDCLLYSPRVPMSTHLVLELLTTTHLVVELEKKLLCVQ